MHTTGNTTTATLHPHHLQRRQPIVSLLCYTCAPLEQESYRLGLPRPNRPQQRRPIGGKPRFEHIISLVYIYAEFNHACHRGDPSARGGRMHQLGNGKLAAVREKQVERFEAVPAHRSSQDAAGIGDQVQAERGADIAASARAEVRVCASREEMGDEGWVAGCKAAGYMSSA
jgi:hypothetical protein